MIRDGLFQPDASRANYFPHAGAQAAGTPSHVVMQPFTPAFIDRQQPGTPCMDIQKDAHKQKLAKPEQAGLAAADTEVKSEASWSLLRDTAPGQVIELTSSSEGDSSESETCGSTSGDDGSIDLDDDEPAPLVNTCPSSDMVMVKNKKTKVVHEACNDSGNPIEDNAAFEEALLGKLTKCGHVITASYQIAMLPIDWTAKCRVCYKGRRQPQ